MIKKKNLWGLGLVALLVAACADVSYVQTESPANPYKEYREYGSNNAVLGIGKPISERQMKANALMNFTGRKNLAYVMEKLAGTYNVAVRWGNGVRKKRVENVLISDLSFDEARSYVEDVYGVQIIREGERRLLVLPSASEPRVELFAPGQNITLSQAVRGLAEQCDFNIVIAENKEILANSRVTTTLKDVTCYDAFSALLGPRGLSLEDKGDYFIIGGLPSRQWKVNLDEPERETEREVSYTSSFSGSNSDTGNEQELGGTSSVKILDKRDLWGELKDDLNLLLENNCLGGGMVMGGASGGSDLLPPPTMEGGASSSASISSGGVMPINCGYVRVNKSVGMVQMQAAEHVLDQADEIIRSVEDIAGRRLLLEARVIAVKRSRDFEQGSSFGIGKDVNIDGGAGSSIAAQIVNALVDVGTSDTGFRFEYDGNNLDSVIKLVEQYGTTYQLMQPMMELVDRQQSTMIDGTTQPFIVRTVSTESTEAGLITNINTELRYQFLGLQFSATAQIAEEGELHTISVQIPILSKTDDFAVPVYSGAVQIGSDDIPIAETRLIDQKVRMRDGEIKVIGGLTKTVAIDREGGVPLLRDIPILGKGLGGENISYEKVEFIVLLQVRRVK